MQHAQIFISLFGMKKLLFYITLALLAACSKTESTSGPSHEAYLPFDAGLYRIYQCTAIVIDEPSGIYDTVNYYVKEIQTGLITDAADDSVLRIERFYSDSLNAPWQAYNVFALSYANKRFVQTEENTKYVKLLIPVVEGKTWNGNAMNRTDTLQQYSYEITKAHQPYTLNNLYFDSVVMVQQAYDSSLVLKIDNREYYAYGVGTIYRQSVDLESQDIDPTLAIEERVTRGTSLFQTLISFGYENEN